MISTRRYLMKLREADLYWGERLQAERDKATAQTQRLYDYEKQKANQLREQIGEERNLYPTKTELTAAIEKVEAARDASHIDSRTFVVAASGVGVGFVGIVVAVLANAGIFG